MRDYYESPDEPRPGDRFELVENCIHSIGEIIEVLPARNAAGRPGHVVIWRDELGVESRTRWSYFRDNARRIMSPPAPGEPRG